MYGYPQPGYPYPPAPAYGQSLPQAQPGPGYPYAYPAPAPAYGSPPVYGAPPAYGAPPESNTAAAPGPPAPAPAPTPVTPANGAPAVGSMPYPAILPTTAPPQAPPGDRAPQGQQPGQAYPTQPPAQQPQTAPFTFGQAPPGSSPYPTQPHAAPAYQAPTTYAPAPGHGQRRKRALLIGCGYPRTQAQLNGCLNDVRCMEYLLKSRFGFQDSQILILRDDVRDEHYTSYKRNIYKGIHWLTMDVQQGDSLVFHFSGHGSQKRCVQGDEDDGLDETICPTDYTTAGQIVDNELNALLVRPLLPGATLHAIIDACHSGTVLDLPFHTMTDSYGRFTWKGYARADKASRGGVAFQFGACKDHQVAADTNRLSGTFTGAATFSFIQAIERYGAQQSYGQLLSHMYGVLHSQGAPSMPSGLGGMLGQLLLGASMPSGQTPVLSCDRPFDLNTPLMLA